MRILNPLLSGIAEAARIQFGIRFADAVPISRGYMNEKWRVTDGSGAPLFVKSFHPDRYRKHEDTVWDEIDRALRLQMLYARSGGACPTLYGDEERGYVHREPRSGRRFVITSWSEGDVAAPGQVGEAHMRRLGETAGRMHWTWNDAAEPSDDRRTRAADRDLLAPPPSPPVWTASLSALREQWHEIAERHRDAPPELREALRLQGEALAHAEHSMLDRHQGGWAHLDLWTENMLFGPCDAVAILDFDRVRWSYPAHDVGRAVLSCALDGHRGLRLEAIAAFAEGYRSARPLPKGAVLDAVRRCWLIESFWWIRPAAESWSAAPNRFAAEMRWVAANWDRLEQWLGDV